MSDRDLGTGEDVVKAKEAGQDLQQDLSEVASLLQDWEYRSASRARLLEAGKVVGDFRHHLLCHFAQEEHEGFLEPVLRRAPERTSTVEQLKSEHTALRQDIDRLHHDFVLASYGGKVSLGSLRAALADLVEALQDHERRESDLIQAVYYRDTGTKD
jgi:hypothetical protein